MQNTSNWNISFIASVNSSIDIVRDNNTGLIMLRREMPSNAAAVMQKLVSIRHRNLMSVFDVRLINGKCVTLCEYINGITLEKRVEQEGALKVTDAVNILCQICDGLTALHSNSIVHRDIKPSNVMITADGTVKIIDYDISRQINPVQSRDTTIMGTEGYAPPEQFGFAQTDARTDIYSCGVLLNYLLTGSLPNERMYQGALTNVIEQCTEIDVTKRFQSANDLKMILSGKKINNRRSFRPLPGFRGKHLLPKVLTVLLMIMWGTLLLIYITGFKNFFGHSADLARNHFKIAVTFLLLWSAVPYFLFGDIFRLSEKINPNNPQNGKYVLRILGIISFIGGAVLMLVL